jgi:hypothetical protein
MSDISVIYCFQGDILYTFQKIYDPSRPSLSPEPLKNIRQASSMIPQKMALVSYGGSEIPRFFICANNLAKTLYTFIVGVIFFIILFKSVFFSHFCHKW